MISLWIGVMVHVCVAGEVTRWDLELDDGGFLSTGDTLQWSWGPVSYGPESGYDGLNAWSTGRSRAYLNESLDHLEIPLPDLSGLVRPMVRFESWYEIAPGDLGYIEVNEGAGWYRVAPVGGYSTNDGFSGSSAGWEVIALDLGGLGNKPGLRLTFSSDSSGVAAGWTIDRVELIDGDAAPPTFGAVTAPVDTEAYEGPFLVTAEVFDDTSVAAVELYWIAGESGGSVTMSALGSGVFQGEIPGPLLGDVVWQIQATDGENIALWPVTPGAFRVYLAAPTDLRGPEGRYVGVTAPLSWTAPESIHTPVGYQILRDGSPVLDVSGLTADVPMLGEGDRYSVRAVYEAGPGDASEEIDVDAVVPRVGGLDPAAGWPGETLNLTLTGEYLLLVQGEVGVSLGEGVEVGDVEVEDVDTARVRVMIDAAAPAGVRTLTVESAAGSLSLEQAFTVFNGADLPRVLDVTPAVVTQGAALSVTVQLSETPAADLLVDLGAGVVVESVQVDGATLTLSVVVDPDAALGARAVRVDDGVRIYEGATLQVDDRGYVVRRCGTEGPAGGLLVIAALGLLRRRRGAQGS